VNTGEPGEGQDIQPRYEKYILENSGIRFIESDLFNGSGPKQKELLQEVLIEHDLDLLEAVKETAEEFTRLRGNKVEIFEIAYFG